MRELDELDRRADRITAHLDSASQTSQNKGSQWDCSCVTCVFLISLIIILICSYIGLKWMQAFQEAMDNTFKPL